MPIMFGGYGLVPQKVARRVHSVDVALTPSLVAGIRPPSGAVGDVLGEGLARWDPPLRPGLGSDACSQGTNAYPAEMPSAGRTRQLFGAGGSMP